MVEREDQEEGDAVTPSIQDEKPDDAPSGSVQLVLQKSSSINLDINIESPALTVSLIDRLIIISYFHRWGNFKGSGYSGLTFSLLHERLGATSSNLVHEDYNSY